MARQGEIVGMRELQRMFQELGRVPQRSVTKGASAGARVALRAAKTNAPVDTGDLKKGIKLKAERKVKVGKKVYDVMMDPAKNFIFAKTSRAGKRSYYPASQEYGFIAVNGRYIPGFAYLKKAMEENAGQIERKVIEVARADVEKVLRGGSAGG